MIIASMCTIPVRRESFDQVLQSILFEQTLRVDRFHIWLNGYQQIPADLPHDPRLILHLEPSNPGPTARYRSAIGLEDNSIFLTLDDDLIYPEDYVEKGVQALDMQDQPASVCFGGVILDWVVPNAELDYRFHKIVITCDGRLDTNVSVPILMGGAGFHYAKNVQSVISTELPGFATNDDMMVSYNLNKQNIKIISITKPSNWIRNHSNQSAPHALYQKDIHTRINTLNLLVNNLGFSMKTTITDEFNQRISNLLISVGELTETEYDQFRMKEFALRYPLHILEIVEIGKTNNNYRTPRDCYEHFVQITDPGGRFEFIPGVSMFRRKRVEKDSWYKVRQYLEWIENRIEINHVEVLITSESPKWLINKLKAWRSNLLITNIYDPLSRK